MANHHLTDIDTPYDLRKLPIDELPQICDELRDNIVNALAVNPGHLASSLGALELTVALHYVFNTPYDRIVWDVGHQAYAHKILTGRRDRFPTNRKLHGLKPFPSPDESEYDTFTCGHASNSISAALNPNETNYFFYALDKQTGTHHFSETYDEHNRFLMEQGDE